METWKFLILLTMSTSAFANPFLLHISRHPTINYKQLEEKIIHHDGYLSLGESHLEPTTSRAFLHKLAKLYLEDRSNVKFCTEKIMSFLDTPLGQDLQQSTQTTLITQRNSPYTTDFKDCLDRKHDDFLVYSGFFHQYPFAKNFQAEFGRTAVQSSDINNIVYQMQPVRSLMVTLIEMPYLLYTSQLWMLRNLSQSKISETYKKLMSFYEVFSRNAQLQSGKQMQIYQMRDDHYLALSVLPDQVEKEKFHFIRKLLEMPQDFIDLFLHSFKNKAGFAGYLMESKDGQYAPMGYGTLPIRFPAFTTLGQINVEGHEGSWIVTSFLKEDRLRCYHKTRTYFKQRPCEEMTILYTPLEISSITL
jgi:hypothetical protein